MPHMLAFLAVLFSMLVLAPARGDADLLFRHQLAEAVTAETADSREQVVLVRLAWFEGSFSRAVASCQVKGDHGSSLGIFQVQPRTAEDRADACGTLNAQVRVALRFIRRSVEVCSANTPETQLALYCSGRCDRGHREAKARWGTP